MPTIRDLIGALRQRDGVQAAIVLGRDGLLIESQTTPQLDAESLAALVPGIVSAADDLAAQGGCGPLATAILEQANGVAVVSVLSADAILLVLAQSTADLGSLLFELRRNREHIAALV